ncbi:hypothetical protein I7I51_07925 [Histoplasma capsulatum]|uniref:Uncharacterized protein n=1 Tax=Ajellomyces capsulatus TaxID=5037 RepID=A0A8A1LWE9_AJECA|nr:hypothetical protein I7I51_07925 [Histoplasma capsulatum]
MKQHEESRPQHSAHLPTPNADGSRPQLLVPQSDPDSVQNNFITSSATDAFDPINIDEMEHPQLSGQCFPGRSLHMIQHAEGTARHNIPTTDETFDHALNTTPLSQASRGPGETEMWNTLPETRQEKSDSRSCPPQYGMGDAWADTLQTRECFMTAGMQLPQYGIPDASAGGYSLADSALIADLPQYGVPDASAGILSLPHPMNSHRQELALITDMQIPQYGISNASAGGTTALYQEN